MHMILFVGYIYYFVLCRIQEVSIFDSETRSDISLSESKVHKWFRRRSRFRGLSNFVQLE